MKKIEILENGNVRVSIQIALRSSAGRKKIITPDTSADAGDSLAVSLARAFRWQRYIDEGKFKNTIELAQSIGIDRAKVSSTIRLTLLSPKIIHRILTYDIPPGLTANRLREAIPELWDEQDEFFNQC